MLTNYYSGLITKGLGLPATAGFITMHFSLFVRPYVPPVVPPVYTGGGGGGHVPVGGGLRGHAVQMRNVPFAGNRTHTYKPTPYLTPAKTGVPHSVIVVKVKFGGKEITREYITPEKRAKMAVKVIGLLTKLQEQMNVIAKGLFEWINNRDSGEK
jgi:hypothetical protein